MSFWRLSELHEKITIRGARDTDAGAMSALLNAIIEAGGTTAHLSRFDENRMVRHYISPDHGICCTVALTGNRLVGFQALEQADPNYEGEWRLPEDWAIIASFVSQNARGAGVGRLLFHRTLSAAARAGVTAIDATIRCDNESGLAYYEAMGFRDYAIRKNIPLSNGTRVDRISKKFLIAD